MFTRLLFSFCLFVLAAAPARADLADTVFEFLKDEGSYVGINPDGVEMARYLYDHTENGAEVIGRAAIQDYPFFGLVGAVKAARDQTFPGIGNFTEAKCNTPITVIDVVFGKATSKISDAAGKAKTQQILGEAQDYAEDYLQAKSEETKNEIKAALADEIPYFGDIPLICHFGFHTNFKAEKDIQKLVTAKVKEAKDIYAAFKKAQIVKGTKLLIKFGVSTETACELVDQGLDAAVVGKIPGVKELSGTVCKGYVGKFINGVLDKGEEIVEGGLDLAEEGVCTVYGWFGGQCNSDVKKPPGPKYRADQFCAPHGGLKSAIFRDNENYQDYGIQCNNFMTCSKSPGKPLRCTTLAQAAKNKMDFQQQNHAEYDAGVPVMMEKFRSKYEQPCPDDICKDASEKLLKDLLYDVIIGRNQGIKYFIAEMDFNLAAAKKGPPILQEAAARMKQKNIDITNEASQGWADIFRKVWTKKCPDQSCRDSVSQIVDEYAAAVRLYQLENPDKSALQSQGTVGRKYRKISDAFVADYVEKYEMAKANTDITKKASEGWEQIYISKWSKECPSEQCIENVKYIAGGYAAEVKSFQKKNPDKSSLEVQGIIGKKYAKLFQAVVKEAQQEASAKDSGAADEVQLGALGCKRWLGREGQWLCTSDKGFAACKPRVSTGEVSLCVSQAANFGQPDITLKMLKAGGCRVDNPGRMQFSCVTEKAMALCQRFKAGGTSVRCLGGVE